MKYKTGYGPMSKEIIEILDSFSKYYPIMITASRNQVDYQNSYVCDQTFLNDVFILGNALLCRDHCGPYFKDSDKTLSLDQAIDECKRTIENDIENRFKIIHIDISRVNDNPYKVAELLIEFALNLDPTIFFEFGSEENNGVNLDKTISKLNEQINFCLNYKNNIKYVVAQTGSLVKDKQIGSFDLEKNKIIAEIIHEAGFLFKEHNGDYFNSNDLTLRKQIGVDAINVAPQLGVIQTSILHQMTLNTSEWNRFANLVYSRELYKKWVNDTSNKLNCVLVSGHYFFQSNEYRSLIDSIDLEQFNIQLKNSIYEVLDFYECRS